MYLDVLTPNSGTPSTFRDRLEQLAEGTVPRTGTYLYCRFYHQCQKQKKKKKAESRAPEVRDGVKTLVTETRSLPGLVSFLFRL